MRKFKQFNLLPPVISRAQSERCREVESEVRAWICRNNLICADQRTSIQAVFQRQLVSERTEIISRSLGRLRIRVQREVNRFEDLTYGGASNKYETVGTPAMEINLLGETFRAFKVEN